MRCYFISQNWSWYNGLFTSFFLFWNSDFFETENLLKFSKMSKIGSFLVSFWAIGLKFMWKISWKILLYFGLGQVQSLKIISLAHQIESLRAWQVKFKVLKDLKISNISGFLLCAIEPIWKDRNDGKLNVVEFWTFLLEFPFCDCEC